MFDGNKEVRNSAVWALSQAIGSAQWSESVVSWWALENGDDWLHDKCKEVSRLLSEARDIVRDVAQDLREVENV